MRGVNPVLRGWHPDPCICKGPDGWHYLVVSTFQWVPGVSLYRSRDLVSWESRGGLLPDLDLLGVPDSAGIWAPDLTFADGKFWLVYTIARGIDGIFKDVENYLVTAPAIDGPWSRPRLLNVSGFDPALFHEGGRHYILNPQWDFRPLEGHRRFNGLILQEFGEDGLIGSAQKILDNDDAVNGLREGPHILKHEGLYYLACAEGGTGRRHRIRMARSESLWGPYEVCPEPLVCAWLSDSRLRKAGHGNLFEGPDGAWYVCHLSSRYLPGTEEGRGPDGRFGEHEAGASPLGRETAIQRIVWKEGWPRLAEGGMAPKGTFEVALPGKDAPSGPAAYETSFPPSRDLWREEWLCPRKQGDWLEKTEEGLVLHGRGSLTSTFGQALLARRVPSFSFEARTRLSAEPAHYGQMAGIACLYDTRAWAAAYVGYDERRSCRVLQILADDEGSFSCPLGEAGEILVPDSVRTVGLAARCEKGQIAFLYGFDGEEPVPFMKDGETVTFGLAALSDEHQEGWAYTGAMVGIFAADVFDRSFSARFSAFSLHEIEEA